MNNKKTNKAKSLKTENNNYTRTGNNIYFDGYSYRVRVSVNGKRISKNFPTKAAAMRYRKELLAVQTALA
jgi:hypothetical protein